MDRERIMTTFQPGHKSIKTQTISAKQIPESQPHKPQYRTENGKEK